jgi:hypothetical protein
MPYGIGTVSCGTLHVPSFMKIDIGFQVILRISLRNLKGCNVGITDDTDS